LQELFDASNTKRVPIHKPLKTSVVPGKPARKSSLVGKKIPRGGKLGWGGNFKSVLAFIFVMGSLVN
jgi:hypothetical protein